MKWNCIALHGRIKKGKQTSKTVYVCSIYTKKTISFTKKRCKIPKRHYNKEKYILPFVPFVSVIYVQWWDGFSMFLGWVEWCEYCTLCIRLNCLKIFVFHLPMQNIGSLYVSVIRILQITKKNLES